MSANGTTAMRRVSGTLRVLIADDDRVSRQLMRRLGDLRDDLCVVAECGAGLAALEPIARHCPDLVLLEVKHAGEDSSELMRRIGACMMPLVIVVATVVDFAPSAFEMAAVDYVVKPFANERLTAALDRAVARYAADAALSELDRLLALAR